MTVKRLIISLTYKKHKILKHYAYKNGKTMTCIVMQALREFMLKHGVPWDGCDEGN